MKEFVTLEDVKAHNSNQKNTICEYCFQALAVWYYMPSDGPDLPSCACDNCVPRGCSCNQELKDWDRYDDEDYFNDPDNWVEELDEKGRRFPCCEWGYYPEWGITIKD